MRHWLSYLKCPSNKEKPKNGKTIIVSAYMLDIIRKENLRKGLCF
jgi:hypothetical protein